MSLRQAFAAFRSPGRIIALSAAVLCLVGFVLLTGLGIRSECTVGTTPVACPSDPVGPDGRTVADQFVLAHQTIGPHATLTVRLTSMTGTITYPPPKHDSIVSGLVPWAKVGIIVKDGTRRGSSYTALMLTGHHGTRLQYDYTHDIAGTSGSVSATAPRWLRLIRNADTITGEESADGTHWHRVARVHPRHLGPTAQIGLFATSPGDLTLDRVALGGSVETDRFTQASGTFDHVTLTGSTSAGWTTTALGEMGQTDWERYHRAPGLTTANGTLTITGSGDIGPIGTEHAFPVEHTLAALPVTLLILIVVASRLGAGRGRRRVPTLAAGATATAAITFTLALLAAAITVPLGVTLFRSHGGPGVDATPPATDLRIVLGAAALLALGSLLAFGLGALLRRGWAAILLTAGTLVLPYAVATQPLLPDQLSNWLLGPTPAAAFAALQTARPYPQVVAHYAPSDGYLPLPWWAGLLVLAAYTAAVLLLATRRNVPSPVRDLRATSAQ